MPASTPPCTHPFPRGLKRQAVPEVSVYFMLSPPNNLSRS